MFEPACIVLDWNAYLKTILYYFTLVHSPPLHPDMCLISILFLSLFRKELRRHGEHGDIAGAIGHSAGHINHIFKASSKDLTAGLSIAQLLVKGGSLLEADGLVLVVVGTSYRHGLSLDLGVEPNKLARVALNCARMGRDLGCVLVVDDAQLERVGVV